VIGLSWSVLDYDDEKGTKYRGFWNLSHKTTMYGNASDLVAFRLMPALKPPCGRPVEADWKFTVLDMDRRLVAFEDATYGAVTSWRWDFGDGSGTLHRTPSPAPLRKARANTSSLSRRPGPAGKDSRTKVWDVVLRSPGGANPSPGGLLAQICALCHAAPGAETLTTPPLARGTGIAPSSSYKEGPQGMRPKSK
jgi:hypothetical protein